MSTLSVKIAGVEYPIIIDSLSIPDRIEQASECNFAVRDRYDEYSFHKGQQVVVTDSAEGTLFTGEIDSSKRSKEETTGSYVRHDIGCRDKHAIPESRSSNRLYTNQYAGPIFIDQIMPLSYRGITTNYAMDQDGTQAEWRSGTHSNTVAVNGNLELAPAGTQINFNATDFSGVIGGNSKLTGDASGIRLNSMAGIKLSAQMTTAGAGNTYVYVKIATSSKVIAANDYIYYDLWIAKGCPEHKASLEIVFTDGTTLSGVAAAIDGESMAPGPGTDLTGLADNQWYQRNILLSTNFSGKTVSYIAFAFGGTQPGQYNAYVRNVRFYNSSSGITTTIFATNATSLPTPPQQLQTYGYTNVSCTFAIVYERDGSTYLTAGSLASAGIYRTSSIAWSEALPADFSLSLSSSTDFFAFYPCTRNAPLQGIGIGQNLAGISLYYQIVISNNSDDPTQTATLTKLSTTVYPAYNTTKSDITSTTNEQSLWNTGTLTNLIATGGNALQLNGFVRDWLDQAIYGQSFYGNAYNYGLYNNTFFLYVGNNTDSKTRMDSWGTWQDFTAEVDIKTETGKANGIVYRTTNWGNNNDTYAYAVQLNVQDVILGRGTNSTGTGGFTQIALVSLSLTSGNWYRLKIVVSGSNHKVYINDVKYIDATDGTYSAAGYVGLRTYNPNASPAITGYFKNFSIVQSLSGTWVSPAINLSSLGSNILGSMTRWDTSGISNTSLVTLLVEISLNNGSTWATCANGAVAPGLGNGVNAGSLTQVELRITMSTTTATAQCYLFGISLLAMANYTASGNRISPALLLSAIGRVGATLAAYNAVQPTGTSAVMATSQNGTSWTNVANGAGIAGINQQAAAIIDNFDLLSAGSYVVGQFGSNIPGSGTWDTANSRLIWTGGNTGTLLYITALPVADNYVVVDLDQSDGSGPMTNRNTGAGVGYYVQIWDASASSTPNTAKLFRRASGTSTQIGSTATISFPRGVPKRFILDVLAGVLTVSMDGNTIITYTDGSPLGAGQSGLVLGVLARCCNLRIQALGDDLAGKKVYGRFTLTSNDPLLTPQVVDSTLLATTPNIGIGSLLDTADYRQTYISDNVDDLTSRSDSHFWTIKVDGSAIFNERESIPAPWCLHDKDVLIAGCDVEESGDLYRNRQTLTGVLADDGSTTCITRDNTGQFPGTISQEDYILQSGISIPATPAILNQAAAAQTTSGDSGDLDISLIESIALDINITAVSGSSPTLQFFVDRKGADGIYYSIWQSPVLSTTGQASTTIGAFCVVDQSLGALVRIRWTIAGTSPSFTFSISILGTLDIEGAGIGVVEAIEDVSSKKLDVAAAQKYADDRIKEYGIYGRTVSFGTTRTGLVAGMALPVTITKHKMQDASTLITSVERTVDVSSSGAVRYWYNCTAVEGPALDNWRKALNQTMKGG